MLTESEKKSFLESASVIHDEAQRARLNYPRFNSIPEAYAILLEEVDELWDEIKKKPALTPAYRLAQREAIRKEAIQVGAMALRLVAELDGLFTE